jgi:Restriction endonuclease
LTNRAYQRRFKDKIEDRDPSTIWMEFGDGYVVPYGMRYAAVDHQLTVIRDADILLQTQVVNLGRRVSRGRTVTATTPSWAALRKEMLKDPSLLECFPTWHRKFEEFVAGGYLASRWSDVTLSPRSRDGGFDIAARKRGRQILDEAKAYKPSLLVPHQVVRAALGLLIEHENIDQVRVTTTSLFAPLVLRDFERLIPEKLTLRDRHEFLKWLSSISSP